MFDSSITDMFGEYKPLQQHLFDAYSAVDKELQPEMGKRIVVGGGNAKLGHFCERLKKEFKALVQAESSTSPAGPSTVNPRMLALPIAQRQHAAWLGGSILGSLASTKWMSKEEYDEAGPSLVHRMFF